MNTNLLLEVEKQYEHWKENVTEDQIMQGLRDYEKFRRDDDNFKQKEIDQLETEFARASKYDLPKKKTVTREVQ